MYWEGREGIGRLVQLEVSLKKVSLKKIYTHVTLPLYCKINSPLMLIKLSASSYRERVHQLTLHQSYSTNTSYLQMAVNLADQVLLTHSLLPLLLFVDG